MKKLIYNSPNVKEVYLSVRRGLCQDASLIGAAIEIEELKDSDIIDEIY